MMNKILIVNTGSASKKYALYSESTELCQIRLEKEKNPSTWFDTAHHKSFRINKYIAEFKVDQIKDKISISPKTYDASISFLLGLLKSKGLLNDKKDISAVGIRVVAPGEDFNSPNFIDKKYLDKLEKAKEVAPLHIIPLLSEIKQLQKNLKGIPMIGISDSAFYANMPQHSKIYGLPKKITSKLEIYRYGYHGISMQSALSKIGKLINEIPKKIIICHLGSGASISAIKDGKPFDTSMGFTPLEGLIMATRVGNIDAGALIYLSKKLKIGFDRLEKTLNTESGLLGISGKSADMRELLELEKTGDKEAKIAIEIFVYQIKKYIGSYAAVMNGLDLLVFTGTIGERSYIIRKRICANLESLNIQINSQENNVNFEQDGFIGGGKTKIAVITANEIAEMAKETVGLLKL